MRQTDCCFEIIWLLLNDFFEESCGFFVQFQAVISVDHIESIRIIGDFVGGIRGANAEARLWEAAVNVGSTAIACS